MLLEDDEHWLVKNLWSEKWLLKVFNNPPHPKVIQRHTGQSFTELYLLEICTEKRPKLIFSEVFGKHIVKFWCEALYCSSAFKPPTCFLSIRCTCHKVSFNLYFMGFLTRHIVSNSSQATEKYFLFLFINVFSHTTQYQSLGISTIYILTSLSYFWYLHHSDGKFKETI